MGSIQEYILKQNLTSIMYLYVSGNFLHMFGVDSTIEEIWNSSRWISFIEFIKLTPTFKEAHCQSYIPVTIKVLCLSERKLNMPVSAFTILCIVALVCFSFLPILNNHQRGVRWRGGRKWSSTAQGKKTVLRTKYQRTKVEHILKISFKFVWGVLRCVRISW